MKRQALSVRCVLLTTVLTATLAAHARADSAGVMQTGPSRAHIGVVDRVENRAEATFAERVRRLQDRSAVYFLDLLHTGPKARLSARLKDGSMVIMGENAELAIDEFVYTKGETREITLRALKGALLFLGEKLFGGDSEVQIRTPVAILGVRGTEVWVGPIDGATGVLVIDGEVSVASAYGFVILGPGEGTMISGDGTLSARKVWGEGKVARAIEMVSIGN
ncbi:FecR family protein [Thiocapsa sp.]|uniref:FecR family protein n=1 Tax=Thiocapsa sp. TaxID=2024551 RepID=UPI0025F1B29B|nr:FecR family protein [Thiocapsa sp.]